MTWVKWDCCLGCVGVSWISCVCVSADDVQSSKVHCFLCYVYVSVSSTWWRHQMEMFSALLALCTGNSPVPVNSPHKGQWRGALMFSFICVWINDWVNNHEAGDLRRHRGHYDVNVMKCMCTTGLTLFSWWRHQKETFSALLVLCEGNPPVNDGFPSQRPVTRSFYIIFD